MSTTSPLRSNRYPGASASAAAHGLRATVVVPHGNSVEKNAAMRAFGAELVEHGEDFQAAREHAAGLAAARGLHFVPSFHRDLVRGVATYWLEFFAAVRPDVVFVPIGLGSGICACALARNHHRAPTRIVGVVSAHATAYLDSFRAGRPIAAPVATRLADGMACRVPEPEALEMIRREVDDVVAVADAEVAAAMRLLFSATHNVAEGAGAAALAALLQQRARWSGCSAGVGISGSHLTDCCDAISPTRWPP